MIIKSVGELTEGQTVITIGPEATITQASQVMRQHNIGALPVLSDERMIGILSERDVVQRVVAEGRDATTTTVTEVMTSDPRSVTPGAHLADAMRVMLDGGFRHCPVVQNGRLIAMVSIRDIPSDYRMMNERFLEYSLAPAE